MEKERKYPMKTKICPYCNGTGHIEIGIDAKETGRMIAKEIFTEAKKNLKPI